MLFLPLANGVTIQVIATDDAGKSGEGMEGRPEPAGERPSSSSPHSAPWLQLLKDANTLDEERPAGEFCPQLSLARLLHGCA